MATTNIATLTFRIDPGLKEALRTVAQQEHRSIANMVEVLIKYYLCAGERCTCLATSTRTRGNERDQCKAVPIGCHAN